MKDPWVNSYTGSLKQLCRRAERIWKAKKTEAAYIALRSHMLTYYQQAVKTAQCQYFSCSISQCGHNPRTLFKVITTVTHGPTTSPIQPNVDTAENLLFHFVQMIENIRMQIQSCPNIQPLITHAPSVLLQQFDPLSVSQPQDILFHISCSSSSLDTIPPRFLKEVFHLVGPITLHILNLFLLNGYFPDRFKHAIIQPLLKKPNLDPLILGNFRPISKLCFLSKILEKAVASQIPLVAIRFDIDFKFYC